MSDRGHPPSPNSAYRQDWYVHRTTEERSALGHLANPGAPAVLSGPRGIGKTWLLKHILDRLRHDRPTDSIVELNLWSCDEAVLASHDGLLRELATQITETLGGPDGWVEQAWSRPGSPSGKLRFLLQRQVLPAAGERLVLAIDRADAVWGRPYQSDFFGMLRGWAEASSEGHWSRLRLLLAISNTPERLVRSTTRSPFNLTPPIRLGDFTDEQVRELARRYQLPWTTTDIGRLMGVVGGHPLLISLLLYRAAEGSTLDTLLALESHHAGVFAEHLRAQRLWLKENDLLEVLQNAVTENDLFLDEEVYHRLFAAGILDQRPDGSYQLRYSLYRRLLRIGSQVDQHV